MTESGSIVGTLHYMSPEQAEGKDTDERSDIFSFGTVLYEMLTGTRAFDGETKTAILAAILKDQPTPIQQLQPAVPRALDRVVRKCLEKKPADRWHSAHDLKPTLELIDLAGPTSASASISSVSGIQPVTPALQPKVAVARRRRGGRDRRGGAAWAFWPSSQQTGRLTRFETPLPEGVEINPSNFYVLVSPDGNKLAFTASGEKAGIWVRDLESVSARLLEGTKGAVSPFWSPDSRSLAFAIGRQLMRIDIAGGPPQVLCESANNVGSGFWTKEGVIVFGGRGTGPLQKVSSAGGVPAPVSVLAGDTFNSLPSLLPDGKHFIYLRAGARQSTGMYIGSLDAKPEEQGSKRISAGLFGATFARSSNSAGGHLFFLRDGTLMAQPFDVKKLELTGEPVPVAQQIGTGPSHGHFSVTPNGLLAYRTGPGTVTQFSWLDRQGKTVESLGQSSTFQAAVTISPDESQVAIFRSETNDNASGDFFVLDRARNIETRFTFGQSVSLAPGPTRPVWSPDGKQIAYFSKGKIYAKPSSGAGDQRTLLDAGTRRIQPSDWTHDGRFLILYDDQNKVFALPLTASGAGDPVLLLERARHATVSPDGRWLAYVSTESGQAEVYIQPFHAPGQPVSQSGAKWQVSRNGGTAPRWRADGKELFFMTDGFAMSAGIEVGGEALRPAAPVQLFPISLRNPSQWDVSRNGQKFLVAEPLDRGSKTPITVVMNWEASLKR